MALFRQTFFIMVAIVTLTLFSTAYGDGSFLQPIKSLTSTFKGLIDFSSVGPGNKPLPKTNRNQPKPDPEPNPLQCVPQNIPQYDPTGGSIFSTVPSVTLFINSFLQTVDKSDILTEAFNISKTTPKQYGDFVKRYTKNVLRGIGVEVKYAAAIGEYAGKAIAPNFDNLTLSIVAPAYAHMAANFLFVMDFLRIDNAEDLGLALAESIASSAEVTLNLDPTSKFPALANGFVAFFQTLGIFTKEKAPLLGYFVGTEWFLAAVKYRCS